MADNCSGDGQLAPFAARYPDVEFIANPKNGGFAYGCNVGASAARGGRLLFLNPDVVPAAGQVGALLAVKDRMRDVAILTARQVNGRGQPQKAWDVFPDGIGYFKSVKSLLRLLWPSRYPNPRGEWCESVYCDWVSGSVLLIDRADFDALGGWCEDYWMYSEDCDLCFRAGRAGMRAACTPEVTFRHLHGGASRQNRAVTVLTKSEAIISRHLFNQRNRSGARRAFNHLFILLAAVPELMLWSALDWLTLRRFEALSIRSSMLARIVAHYRKVLRTGDWRSAQMYG